MSHTDDTQIRALLSEAITLIQQAVSTARDYEALLTEQTELEARCIWLEGERERARGAGRLFDDEGYAKEMMRWYMFEDEELKPLFHLALDSSSESLTKVAKARELFARLLEDLLGDARYGGQPRIARRV